MYSKEQARDRKLPEELGQLVLDGSLLEEMSQRVLKVHIGVCIAARQTAENFLVGYDL